MIGEDGSILLADTTAITGNFRAVQVLTDATFTTLTSQDVIEGGVVATAADFGTLPAGITIYGKFKAVTLATGRVILYK